MPGLILELQADALERGARVSDLLRKALVVSKKLGIEDIERWICNELGGYPAGEKIPDYREVRGEIKVLNPYRGWIPLHFGDAEEGERLSRHRVMQPVGELDELHESAKTGTLFLPFPLHLKNALMDSMDVPMEPCLHIPRTEVVGVLDAVRNNILQWTLELEQKGIVGEGMTFSKEEKSVASQVTYQITNNIGSMSHSQLQQHSSGSSQEMSQALDIAALGGLVARLRENTSRLQMEPAVSREYEAELQTLDSQLSSPKPKRAIISESLRSVRTILEGASGNMIASSLLPSVSAVLAALT